MKVSEKSKPKKEKTKKRTGLTKPKKEHVLIVAQEIKFARLLAGNEKKTRDRALKSLKKWLLNCFQKGYEFKETDFTRIWKGLFYSVWMSDKPLVQEELCESIAGILDLFPPEQLRPALLMAKVGLRVLATEWYGIDHHRMDKCLMLVRRYVRGSLRCARRGAWSQRACAQYADMLVGSDGILALKTPLYARNATSMVLHVIDCFLEELAKVSEGDISPASVAELLRPFCAYMCGGEVPALATACRRLLTALMRQSDAGLRYHHATRAWEKMGCPSGGPEALELVSDDDEQNGDEDEQSDDDENSADKPLDPRAGRVDVVLPTVPVPSREVADMLRQLLHSARPAAHRRAKICLQRFEQLSKDEYPLRVKGSPTDVGPPTPRPLRSARSLQTLEKQLVMASDELALRGLSRKHRKRLLARSRAGISIVEDAETLHRAAGTANGNWLVEDTSPPDERQDTSNKENVHKHKRNKRKLDQKQKCDDTAKKQKTDVTIKNQPKEKKKNNEINKQKSAKDRNAKLTNGVSKTNKSRPDLSPKKTINVVNTEVVGKNKKPPKPGKTTKKSKTEHVLLVNKVKNFQKLRPKTGTNFKNPEKSFHAPKKVQFVLKNNSMQGAHDYYKSVRKSPKIPFDSSKTPSKTNLKVSTPSPINPFFKKKLRQKKYTK